MKRIVIVALVLLATRQARALNSCSFGTVLPVAFGNYNPLLNSDLDGAGSFQYKCTISAPVTIDIDYGARGNRTLARVLGGTDTMTYALFQDVTRLIPWGNTALTHMIVVLAPTSFGVPVGVYGRLTKKQDVQPGDYNDTVTITIDF